MVWRLSESTMYLCRLWQRFIKVLQPGGALMSNWTWIVIKSWPDCSNEPILESYLIFVALLGVADLSRRAVWSLPYDDVTQEPSVPTVATITNGNGDRGNSAQSAWPWPPTWFVFGPTIEYTYKHTPHMLNNIIPTICTVYHWKYLHVQC